MGNPNTTEGGQDFKGLMDKTARQAQFRVFATAPKPAPRNAEDADKLARLIVNGASDIMGNPSDARAELLTTFPNLAVTPEDVPQGAVAPDLRYSFLLALKRALNELPN